MTCKTHTKGKQRQVVLLLPRLQLHTGTQIGVWRIAHPPSSNKAIRTDTVAIRFGSIWISILSQQSAIVRSFALENSKCQSKHMVDRLNPQPA
jgi:hypothetical protein